MSVNFRGGKKASGGGCGRWGARLTLMAAAAILVALAVPSSAFALTTQRITTGAVQASHQEVSGDRIVWQASDGSHLEIYTWTSTGGVVKLTSASADQTLPQISGDRIVWQGSDGTTSQIFTWTQASGIVQISDNTTSNNTAPEVSGDRIVWQASDGTDLEIYSWTPTDGVVKITDNSTNDTKPQVSGDRIVWQGLNGTDNTIYTWTPSGGVAQVSDDTSSNNTVPQVSGDRIVWQGSDGIDLEIYTWTPSGGIAKVTNNGSADTNPQVSGDTIVWTNHSSTYEVYTWTPAGGIDVVNYFPFDSDPTPQVDGDRVVWAGNQNGYGYVGNWRASSGPSSVVDASYLVSSPQVSGERVVWAEQSSKGGAFDIYTTTVPDPTITSISPSFGAGAGGTTVTITGSGFEAMWGTDVTFGGIEAKNITIVSDAKMTAVSPPHQAGTVRVKVKTDVGETADSANADFIYLASPGTSESFKAAAIQKFASHEPTSTHPEWTTLGLSGDRLAWDAYDGTAWQVYTWDPVAGTQKISTGSNDNVWPIVSGDRVAWTSEDNTGNNWQVFTWTPTGGTVQLTQGGQQGSASDVDGDRVVWDGTSPSTGTSSEVYTWTPATGTVAITSNAVNNYSPAVSGDRIVWEVEHTTGCDIMTWTPTGGAVRVANCAAEYYNASYDVSGNRVVWTDWTNVYTWTPGATASQKLNVAGTTGSWTSPVVDGNRVVWTADNDSGDAVYTWTPTGGTVCLSVGNVDPEEVDVSGDRVVWSGSFMSSVPATSTGAGDDIYSWTPGASISMVSSGKGESYNPCVSGDRLAWVDDDGIDTTVMSALPVPTVNSITPSSGLPTGGNTVTINGTGFYGVTGASGVTFDGVNATSYTVNSSTKITAVVPAHALGKVEVVVNGSEGSSPTDGPANDYSYAYPRFEQTLANFGFSSGWTSYANGAYSGGSYKYTNVAGSSVTIAFTGTRFNWITVKGPGFGKASVVIDNAAPSEVDLYNATNAFQQNVLSTGTLTSGLHVVTITCEGTKNASSSGTFIGLDAVETDGTLATVSFCEQSDTKILYKGAWSGYSSSTFSGGSYYYTKTAGTMITIPFSGQQAQWIATKGPVYGIANVSVDGGGAVPVDLYAPTYEYKQIAYSTGILTTGAHTLTITYTATKNGSATDTYINADAFQVVGTFTPATRFDQTNAKFVWTKTWSLGSSIYCYGSSQRYVNTSGASVRINFTGVSLTYIATKAASMGKAYVSLDGGTAVLVDLYNATTAYQQKVWSTGALTPGNHYVTITWSGQKRAGATGTYINIDAVDVVGTLK